jgi:hypothetical protein
MKNLQNRLLLTDQQFHKEVKEAPARAPLLFIRASDDLSR